MPSISVYFSFRKSSFLAVAFSLLLTHCTWFSHCTWGAENKLPKTAPVEQLQIQQEDLDRHINFLASDTLEGRESGRRGGKAAGSYIVSELTQYGLHPAAGTQNYFQEFGAGYRNILASIPGSDPELASEYVFIGAHYDHVGYGNRTNSLGPIGQIHNGADDNASGTSLVLELAQAVSQLEIKPKRTIVFAFWDAEERGLLGSQHWCNNPTLDLNQVKFYFNYDMVGHLRKNELETYGVRTLPHLQRLLVQHNHGFDLNLIYNWDTKRESDHYPFYQKNIPYLMLHTGKHSYYHRPTDDVHRINKEGELRITQFSGALLLALANQDQIPPFRSQSRNETDSRRRFEAGRSVNVISRLGISWKRNEDNPALLEVDTVVTNSVANRFGLQSGDLIHSFGNYPLDKADFRTLVLRAQKLTNISTSRPPSIEVSEDQIELAGSPQLLGVKLRFDLAEPGSPIITYVTPGSPADYAGLKKGDMIWSLNGVWPETEEDFFNELKKIKPQSEEMKLTRERTGQLEELTVDLWPKER